MADSNSTTIALPAIMDLDALDGVRDKLVDALEGGHVELDAAAVERVSTNALVMLMSASETAHRNHFEFKVARASEPMLAAIDRLGFGPSLAGIMKG